MLYPIRPIKYFNQEFNKRAAGIVSLCLLCYNLILFLLLPGDKMIICVYLEWGWTDRWQAHQERVERGFVWYYRR